MPWSLRPGVHPSMWSMLNETRRHAQNRRLAQKIKWLGRRNALRRVNRPPGPDEERWAGPEAHCLPARPIVVRHRKPITPAHGYLVYLPPSRTAISRPRARIFFALFARF